MERLSEGRDSRLNPKSSVRQKCTGETEGSRTWQDQRTERDGSWSGWWQARHTRFLLSELGNIIGFFECQSTHLKNGHGEPSSSSLLEVSGRMTRGWLLHNSTMEAQ